jgi:hypothetical protein
MEDILKSTIALFTCGHEKCFAQIMLPQRGNPARRSGQDATRGAGCLVKPGRRRTYALSCGHRTRRPATLEPVTQEQRWRVEKWWRTGGELATSSTAGNKKGLTFSCKPLILLVRPARFERATNGFVVRYSIQLSYGRVKGNLLHKAQRFCQVLGANSLFFPNGKHEDRFKTFSNLDEKACMML